MLLIPSNPWLSSRQTHQAADYRLAFSRSRIRLPSPAVPSSATFHQMNSMHTTPRTNKPNSNFCWLSLPAVPTPSGCNRTIQPQNFYQWVPIPKLSPSCQWVEQSLLHRVLLYTPPPRPKNQYKWGGEP